MDDATDKDIIAALDASSLVWHDDIAPNTPEWDEYRRDKINVKANASEAPCVMGVAKYGPRTIAGLRRQRLGMGPPESDYQKKLYAHGHHFEEAARAATEQKMETILMPRIASRSVTLNGQTINLSASFDGVSPWGSSVEIKCPEKGKQSSTWVEAEKDIVPPWHWPQVVHQSLVLHGGAHGLAQYVVYDAQTTDMLIINTLVTPEDKISLVRGWFAVWAELTAPVESELILMRDNAWQQAADEYRAAHASAWAADKDLEIAKAKLLALSDEAGKPARATGYGVQVERTKRKGNVDYSKIPQLSGVDLEKYRKKEIEVVSVRIIENDEV